MDSLNEASQLIKDIDETIAYTNDPVVKRALQKAGLSSEEMIALLRESRSYVQTFTSDPTELKQ